MWPSWRARSGIAAISQAKGVLDACRGRAMRAIRRCRVAARCMCGRAPEVVAAYSDKVRFRARRQAQYAALRSVPAVTLDGERVSLNINAGLVFDLPHLDQSGA